MKVYREQNVLDAARERIALVFDRFERIIVSFSAGKDSGVLAHLVLDEAKRRNRKVAMLFVDLEAQYRLTVEHAEEMFRMYSEHIEPYWVCLPLILRNAVSQYEPRWVCWDPRAKADWVRQPSELAITDGARFPFFRPGMEFEEFVEDFNDWYGGDEMTACFIGIRTDESLNRFRSLSSVTKSRYEGLAWTTWLGRKAYNAYPLYDWRVEDVWAYYGTTGRPYNRLYDLMHKAGLTLHQQRICQPYGDDQRRGLWLYHLIEPETWGRVVARVNGANFGAEHARSSGNILGIGRVTLPPGHTWKSFSLMLLETMPQKTSEHFKNKIAVFIQWWKVNGVERAGIDCSEDIPDDMPDADDGKKRPSWRRIAKVLLRNDYWCKGLGLCQTKSEAYEAYLELMKRRRAKWGLFDGI